MNRDRATKIIRRIVQTIEANQTPAAVCEVYVFGSYARGAMEPNDLDLIVVHDPPPVELMESFKRRADELGLYFMEAMFYPAKRFKGAMSKAMRKPGEAIDVLMGESLDAVAQKYPIVRDEQYVLLWSLDDRNMEAKLRGIQTDPSAGRADRPGFITAKEAGCSAEQMRHVAAMLDRDMLRLTRWELPDGPPEVQSPLRERYVRWIEMRAMGRKSSQCLPYAFRWLQDQGLCDVRRNGTEVCDKASRFFASVGPMALHHMLWRLEHGKTNAVCLIPHFKRGRPREAFEFRRGSAWSDDWYTVVEELR